MPKDDASGADHNQGILRIPRHVLVRVPRIDKAKTDRASEVGCIVVSGINEYLTDTLFLGSAAEVLPQGYDIPCIWPILLLWAGDLRAS